jgi:hypothetical protein
MFLYPADKNFIEPCPLSNPPSGPLCAGELEAGKEVRVESGGGGRSVEKQYTREKLLQFNARQRFDFLTKIIFRLSPPSPASFPEHELEKAFSGISMQFLLGYR